MVDFHQTGVTVVQLGRTIKKSEVIAGRGNAELYPASVLTDCS